MIELRPSHEEISLKQEHRHGSSNLTPLAQASLKTADNLHTIAQRSQLSLPKVERLTLPELTAVVEQVARLAPAGNVPGMILSGLARLPERRPPAKIVRRDLNLLFRGVEQTLDKAVFTAFFAGPAAVIGAYQHLLKLAGKDPAEAFPEGTWQFYVEYAVREDTARHANETHGFDTFLRRHDLDLNPVDRATAWVMAAIYCLHQYYDLLANEWRERVATHLLVELTRNRPDAAHYAQLYRRWEKLRPYGRNPAGGSRQPYFAYRRDRFDQFLAEALADLDTTTQREWQQALRRAEAEELPAFQQQMSILAYLDPGPYGETRVPIPLTKACIGLLHRGCYFLIPACAPGSDGPAHAQRVRAMVAAALDQAGLSGLALPLAQIKRSAWPDLRQKLDRDFVAELDRLRFAPILLNCDRRPRDLPLAEIRQADRGRGDHALTLFDTGETMVFDQSHIFFDGAWGAALAEMITQEAVYWAKQLGGSAAGTTAPWQPQKLAFHPPAADLTLLRQAPTVAVEVTAETAAIDLKALVKLRRLFKQRNDLIQVTINDLLILYRAIHALTYQPDPQLIEALEALAAQPESRQAALVALDTLRKVEPVNPTILIPVDASQRAPRDRLYPVTFEAPLTQLGFVGLHRQVMAAWKTYQQAAGDRSAAYAEFDRLQREYLATLAGFGQILEQVKASARAGESLSLNALKLLAHFPAPLQHLLEKVPASFDLLNDLLKGREVFSNVGAVVPGSTLTRFISAKDDNDKKTLVWGVLTDAQGVLRLTLRDFRPHGALLLACGHKALAQRLTQHYLDAYAEGLNKFAQELRQITQSSRETHLRNSRITPENLG
ncbi:MAG: hypothetical protein DPW09_23785 [Anaerolineae bacterium]|nr:hypothetical protein [Anaerolineales bacterium]MCQ3976464.1 hypothetical protein [Anaerolineae bacterium]